MADMVSSTAGQPGSPQDDNGFEKVQHADISPSAAVVPPPSFTGQSGVEDLYGGSSSLPGGDIMAKPLTPSPVPQTVQITSGTSSGGVSPTSGGSSGISVTTSASASSPVVVTPGAKPEESKAACCCAWMKAMDPRLLDLIYWRDVKKTGAVFGSLLILLLSLALFSVLSVVAYLSLIVLTITVTFRLYKNVMAAVQKSGEGHPFKPYLEMDISVPDERVRKAAEEMLKSLMRGVNELRRLFLVDDMVDSLKFGLLLWVLTYIGAWFNGMTLIILAVVDVFTLPKVYEVYKVQIDEFVDLARNKIQIVYKQIQEKLPLPGKKKQA
jgi:hypothetical protein